MLWLTSANRKKVVNKNNIMIKMKKANNYGNCITCRFKKNDNCVVGTYYAEKGGKAICYEGEFWEAKIDHH